MTDPEVSPAQQIEEGRRFDAGARLLGNNGFARIVGARVVIVGLGGVGSWAAEALARTGVGQLTLIDLDHVAESNINRQVMATSDTLGAAKVTAMAERIAQIAPACRVIQIDDFIDVTNVDDLIPVDAQIVIDAIDNAGVKAALVACCVARQQRVLVSGAAGGRLDPLRLQHSDLAHTHDDSLLARVRKILRRKFGFSRRLRDKFGVPVVYSDELLSAEQSAVAPAIVGGSPLSCAGYGSIVTVTATMGMALAAEAIRQLTSELVTNGCGVKSKSKAQLEEIRREMPAR